MFGEDGFGADEASFQGFNNDESCHALNCVQTVLMFVNMFTWAKIQFKSQVTVLQ